MTGQFPAVRKIYNQGTAGISAKIQSNRIFFHILIPFTLIPSLWDRLFPYVELFIRSSTNKTTHFKYI